jgi:hypothetical protein
MVELELGHPKIQSVRFVTVAENFYEFHRWASLPRLALNGVAAGLTGKQ